MIKTFRVKIRYDSGWKECGVICGASYSDAWENYRKANVEVSRVMRTNHGNAMVVIEHGSFLRSHRAQIREEKKERFDE